MGKWNLKITDLDPRIYESVSKEVLLKACSTDGRLDVYSKVVFKCCRCGVNLKPKEIRRVVDAKGMLVKPIWCNSCSHLSYYETNSDSKSSITKWYLKPEDLPSETLDSLADPNDLSSILRPDGYIDINKSIYILNALSVGNEYLQKLYFSML